MPAESAQQSFISFKPPHPKHGRYASFHQGELDPQLLRDILHAWTLEEQESHPLKFGQEYDTKFRQARFYDDESPMRLRCAPDIPVVELIEYGKNNDLFDTVMKLVDGEMSSATENVKRQVAHEVIAAGIFKAEQSWSNKYLWSRLFQTVSLGGCSLAALAIGVFLTPGSMPTGFVVLGLGVVAWWTEKARRKSLARASAAPDFSETSFSSLHVDQLRGGTVAQRQRHLSQHISRVIRVGAVVPLILAAYITHGRFSEAGFGVPDQRHPLSPSSAPLGRAPHALGPEGSTGAAEPGDDKELRKAIEFRPGEKSEDSLPPLERPPGPAPTEIPFTPSLGDHSGGVGLGMGM